MQRGEVLRLLPEIMQAADRPASPMAGLLDAMVHLLEPTDRMLEATHELFDPATSADPFPAMLAAWLGLGGVARELVATMDDREIVAARLGALVFEGPELLRGRGTLQGLERVLTVVGGVPVTIVEPDDRPFHIVVEAVAAHPGLEALLRRVLELERPVHVTYELRLTAPSGDSEAP